MEKIGDKYNNYTFENIKHIDDYGNEYWFARDLQKVLEYKDWRNFQKVIDKAVISAKNSVSNEEDWVVEVNKPIKTGKGKEELMILIPVIVFAVSLCKEAYLINNSEIILSYHSRGNGGFGDSHDFVYAVSDKYCKEISVDVDLSYGFYNKMFLPKKLKKVTENELYKKGIEVVIEDKNRNKYISIYKNKKLIHKKKLNEGYFNIELDSVFYNE